MPSSNKRVNRIHIFGCSGSGKTWLGNNLSEKHGISHCDLDDIFWDNTKGTVGFKTPVEERNSKLKEILAQESWVIEGVYYDWVDESFEKADKIIVLNIPLFACRFRIITRFLKRKVNGKNEKKESLRSLRDLLKWTKHFQTVNYQETMLKLKPYQNKVVYLTSKKAVCEYLRQN